MSWAIRVHQALRFFPDESVGYEYPDMYVKYFGADYQPEPYIVAEYERARNHKWYMTARQICVNDIYSFDPNAKVDLDDFVDIIGRNFKQPKEGLGPRQQPFGAHVAHADVADPVPVSHTMKSSTIPLPALTALDRPNSYIGRSVPRPNLARLTQGRAQFVSDLRLPRMAHVAFVRSPHAHARIMARSHAASQGKRPACIAVVTGASFQGDHALGRRAHPSQGHQVGAAARARRRARPLAGRGRMRRDRAHPCRSRGRLRAGRGRVTRSCPRSPTPRPHSIRHAGDPPRARR